MTRISVNRKIELTSLATLLAIVMVCGACAPTIQLTTTAHGVVVAHQPPPASSRNLGLVIATHGNGCGFVGLRGTEEGALALLKNKAADMGADYVQIEKMIAPHRGPGCLHNEYRIEGTSYVQIVGSLTNATTSGR